MPREVFDVKEFLEISKRAKECRVKRLKNLVKLKLRTRRMLYTIKLSPEEAERVLGQIKCEIREI